jgi:hypothetical protein
LRYPTTAIKSTSDIVESNEAQHTDDSSNTRISNYSGERKIKLLLYSVVDSIAQNRRGGRTAIKSASRAWTLHFSSIAFTFNKSHHMEQFSDKTAELIMLTAKEYLSSNSLRSRQFCEQQYNSIYVYPGVIVTHLGPRLCMAVA